MITVRRDPAARAARDAARFAAAQAAARDRINRLAGEARRPFITDIAGQEMIYLGKEAEARAYLADPAPDPADYPMLMAEVGLTAATPGQLAQLWLQMGAIWRQVAAAIEGARMTALIAVDAAATESAIDAAVTGMTASMEALNP
jgi:hypothetical protein